MEKTQPAMDRSATDPDYRERLIGAIPAGANYTAKEIGTSYKGGAQTEERIARAEELDLRAEPGPWEVDDDCVLNEHGQAIAEVYDPGNARLIAESRSLIPSFAADCRRLIEENKSLRESVYRAERRRSAEHRRHSRQRHEKSIEFARLVQERDQAIERAQIAEAAVQKFTRENKVA